MTVTVLGDTEVRPSSPCVARGGGMKDATWSCADFVVGSNDGDIMKEVCFSLMWLYFISYHNINEIQYLEVLDGKSEDPSKY